MGTRAVEHPSLGGDQRLVTIEDIRAARERVAGVIRPTPAEPSEPLSELAGRPIILKPEQRQRTGSFKIRGAYNRISRLPEGTPVVAGSAGNHAQGVALAAKLTGHPATIFMPVNAPLPKVEATRNYGATVRMSGQAVDDCIASAKDLCQDGEAVFVPPFDDPLIVAGQGTIGLELAEEAPEAGTVVVPVGGGGLISGIAAALAAVRPGVRVVGVEAAGAPTMVRSLEAGRVVRLERLHTMADGIALKSPSPLTLAHVQAYVDEVALVSEEEISQALLLLLERAKAVVEPSGATARRPGRRHRAGGGAAVGRQRRPAAADQGDRPRPVRGRSLRGPAGGGRRHPRQPVRPHRRGGPAGPQRALGRAPPLRAGP
jgi:threonine dehydratase